MSNDDLWLRPEGHFRAAIAEADSQKALALTLERLLSSGLGVWADGSLYHIRVEVERVAGLSLRVYSRDHNPPHFHVVGPGVNIRFKIDDLSPLDGALRGQRERLVEWWFLNGGREALLRVWRETRPG